MLTLKVITTDIDGQRETHLFHCERISHMERTKDDAVVNFISSDVVIIGEIPNKLSTQEYVYSRIFLYDKDGMIPKALLYVLPCADCYVMYDGKTVDTFSARFKQ